jgi:hypothetical protein
VIVQPVAALIASLPPAWSGCQCVFHIWVTSSPRRRLAQIDVGFRRIDAHRLAAGGIVQQIAVIV